MAAPKKKQVVDRNYILSEFMTYVLEHERYPVSVYKFCKVAKLKEEEFYKFFGNLESIRKSIWSTFFEATVEAMKKNKEYASFSSREKMLTLFYSLFETMTLNRSYILFVLKYHDQPMKNLKQLKGLRLHIKDFAADLIEEDNDEKKYKLAKNPVPIFSEGAWLQFLFLLNFWVGDESSSFEKTDIAIEKSVNTIFDLFDNTPLTNVLDFGKFLWNEKVMWN
ncbi:TetR/AcrR family transcriptional regulator [Aquimarina sp. U1-2]|uniref:TetR family transcriptional regulator C-terminal domain-containing protein n=1 Tax=Aquimarina sp. U1-2 TaxID=2823141 RepID=UPI001AECBE8D|nr:TetR family transcriptional regulator C-terminal domain-containing protein [Aquimarina sp. U1-2]MBP2832254.1 TetR/AcrR family transcriptional regulator [Aquimarina sp. U1-2]